MMMWYGIYRPSKAEKEFKERYRKVVYEEKIARLERENENLGKALDRFVQAVSDGKLVFRREDENEQIFSEED